MILEQAEARRRNEEAEAVLAEKEAELERREQELERREAAVEEEKFLQRDWEQKQMAGMDDRGAL